MAIHDWTLVNPGVFHDFHNSWITEIRNVLNEGLLPEGYYALGEQVAGDIGPDVLTLRAEKNGGTFRTDFPRGATVVADAPPKVSMTARAEAQQYTTKQRSLVIRHSTGDRMVAIVELLSPGNKSAVAPFRKLMKKVISVLSKGIHLVLVDLFLPTKRDPEGIHGAVWKRLVGESFKLPKTKKLTVVSYAVGADITAYIEPCAVGGSLPQAPLFLTPDAYVALPMERTYQEAFAGVPSRWKLALRA